MALLISASPSVHGICRVLKRCNSSVKSVLFGFHINLTLMLQICYCDVTEVSAGISQT